MNCSGTYARIGKVKYIEINRISHYERFVAKLKSCGLKGWKYEKNSTDANAK